MPDETSFERAIRLARENEARLARQQALIARLEEARQDHLLPEARRMLAMMEHNRRLFSTRLRTVFDPPDQGRGH